MDSKTFSSLIYKALQRAYKEAGTQQRLEAKTGVNHAQISQLLTGKRSCERIQVDTLAKLFPDLDLSFFRDERPSASSTRQLSPIRQAIEDKLKNADDVQLGRAFAAIAAIVDRKTYPIPDGDELPPAEDHASYKGESREEKAAG